MKDTVIIVDDEPITRMDLKEILEEAGYDVIAQASDGFDAIDLCRQKHPDIVMMDVKMPVFDGLSAASMITNEELSDCIILLTAYNDKEFIDKAKMAGVMGYLVKPIDEKVLLPTVEVALSKSREIRKIKDHANQMKEQFESRKTIDRAKAILAKKDGISEEEAYQLMRRLSMEKRRSMSDMAKVIIDSYDERSF